MQTTRFSFLASLARKPVAFAFVLLFAGIGASMIALSSAATEATLYLSPAAGEVAAGANMVVTVRANSNTTSVNAVRAELRYDATKFEYISTDGSTSGFGVQAEHTAATGQVTIQRGSIGGVTGEQIVSVVTFKALTPGTATIDLDESSQLLQTEDSTDTLTARTGASYTIVDRTAPSAPGVATAANSAATSITLAWSASEDNLAVTGYNVYRNGAKIGNSPSLTFTDTGLAPSNSYSYAIAAFDAAGNESARSEAATLVTRPDTSAPATVTGLTSPSQTPTSITLNWTSATDDVGVAGYRIARNGAQVGTSATPSYTDSGLTPDTNYSYTVLAYDVAGNVSELPTASSFKTAKDETAPAVPSGLTAVPIGVTGAKLTWNASTDNVGVVGYRIYRNSQQIGTSTALTYNDSGLSVGQSYDYTVAAVDGAGNVSNQTAAVEVDITLKPGDVNGDNLIDLTDLSILLANYSQPGATREKGDMNQDGVVNLFDLSLLLSNWGK